jgi:hypothetical protein
MDPAKKTYAPSLLLAVFLDRSFGITPPTARVLQAQLGWEFLQDSGRVQGIPGAEYPEFCGVG